MSFFFRPRSSRVPRNLSIEHRTPAVQLVRNFQHRNKTEATYTSAIANRPGVRFFVLTLRAGDVLRPSLPVALSDCTDAVVMSQLTTRKERDASRSRLGADVALELSPFAPLKISAPIRNMYGESTCYRLM